MHYLKKDFFVLCAGVILLILTVTSLMLKLKEPIGVVDILQDLRVPVSKCHLPKYSPFDPTILKYIQKWRKIDCGYPQAPLTFADEEGFLHFNQTAFIHSNFNMDMVLCTQQEVIRSTDDDGSFHLGPKITFNQKTALEHEFTVISCAEVASGKLIFETGYAKVKELPRNLAERSQKGATSVLMLVLESTSRLNFIRQLPKTYKFIQEITKGVVLNGLTKVGDNTYPNMMALLTGLTSSRGKLDPALAPFWGNDTKAAAQGYFDEAPFVWKNFSKNDYVTMLAEDLPMYSAFNYHAKGFKKPPTDYYMRPFWLAMEKQTHLKSQDYLCYGHVPKHQFLIRYLEEFQRKMQKGMHSSFSITFITELSHNYINALNNIDEELLILMQNLYSLGVFNNTLVLIMGDHGNRFDEIRQTKIGRVEERMPFLAINLPPSLEHFRPNLEKNVDVLTSWHDVYEMLMDVADNNTLLQSRQLRYGYKGLSLFRPIPNNRTCIEIGIPKEYCVCMAEQELNVNHAESIEAGRSFVHLVNKILEQNEEGKLCHTLELDEILSAQKLLPSVSIQTDSDFSELTRVLVRVYPSKALLEGTVRRINGTEDLLIGDINRVNKYGSQSSCVSTQPLNLICFCK